MEPENSLFSRFGNASKLLALSMGEWLEALSPKGTIMLIAAIVLLWIIGFRLGIIPERRIPRFASH